MADSSSEEPPDAPEGVGGEARAAQEQPGHGGGQDDQREGDGEEVQGDESQDGEADQHPVVEGALADPHDRLHHYGYHDGLYSVEKPVDRRHV